MADDDVELRIPIAEERLLLRKQEVETGRVRIRTEIDEHETIVREALRRTSVEVERVPMDVEVSEIPPVREEDGVTIIPVVRELLVVEKRLILTEEVRLRRTNSVEDHVEPVMLRTQRAVIEREEAGGAPVPDHHQA